MTTTMGHSPDDATYKSIVINAAGTLLACSAGVSLWLLWRLLMPVLDPLIWSYISALAIRDTAKLATRHIRSELRSFSLAVVILRLCLSLLPLSVVYTAVLRSKRLMAHHLDRAKLADEGPAPSPMRKIVQTALRTMGSDAHAMLRGAHGSESRLAHATAPSAVLPPCSQSASATGLPASQPPAQHHQHQNQTQGAERTPPGKRVKGVNHGVTTAPGSPARRNTSPFAAAASTASTASTAGLDAAATAGATPSATGASHGQAAPALGGMRGQVGQSAKWRDLASAAIFAARHRHHELRLSTRLLQGLVQAVVAYASIVFCLSMGPLVTLAMCCVLLATCAAAALELHRQVPLALQGLAQLALWPLHSLQGLKPHSLLSRAASAVESAGSALVSVCASADRWTRAQLDQKLDLLVSGAAIVFLVVGSVLCTLLLLVKVGEESQTAALALNAALRQTSSNANLTGLLWVAQQAQDQLASVISTTLPLLAASTSSFLVARNLTGVAHKLEFLYYSLPVRITCSDQQRADWALAVAAASVEDAGARRQLQAAEETMLGARGNLTAALAAWEGAWLQQAEAPHVQAMGSIPMAGAPAGVGIDHRVRSSSSGSGSGGSGSGSGGSGSMKGGADGVGAVNASTLPVLHSRLVDARSATGEAEAAHAHVAGRAEEAAQRLSLAQRRLRKCYRHLAEADSSGSGLSASIHNALSLFGIEFAAAPHLADNAAALIERFSSGDVRGVWSEALGLVTELRTVLVFSQPGLPLGMRGSGSSAGNSGGAPAVTPAPSLIAAPMPAPDTKVSASGAQCEWAEGSADAAPHIHDRAPSAALASREGEEGEEEEDAQGSGGSSEDDASPAQAIREGGGAVMPVPTFGPWGLLRAAAHSVASTAMPFLGAARKVIAASAGLLVSGLGSWTSLALGAGLNIFKLMTQLFNAVISATLYLTVLFYLLSAETDPLEQIVQVLPISAAARARAQQAIAASVRGVLLSSLKLAAMHALFSWLTLSLAGAHFVYLLSAASAALALVPILPVWLVALPAASQLAVLGHWLSASLLLASHMACWFYVDDLVRREVEGASLPYLTGVGIAGGMALFSNPLKGVLLGPLLLSLLYVGFQTHSQLMGAAAAQPRG